MWRTEARLALLTAAAAAVAAVWGCILPEAERGDDASDGPLTTAGSGGTAVTAGGTGGGAGGGGGQAGDGGAGPASLGKAVTFSGKCAHAEDLTFLDFPALDFTVQFWLQVDTVPYQEAPYQYLVHNGGTSPRFTGWGIYLAYDGVPNKATLSFGTHDRTGQKIVSAENRIVQGNLHHVVVTREGEEGKIFVFDASGGETAHVLANEGDVCDAGSSTLAFSVGSPFLEGCQEYLGFHGTIDDLRVYSVAREPGAFGKDFLGPVACQAESPGLVAYWPFDDFAGEGKLPDSCAGVTLLEARRGAATLDDSPFDSFPAR
jgi:hypothetical protein